MIMWWSNNNDINNHPPPSLSLIGITLFFLLLLTTLTFSNNNGLKLFTLRHGRLHRLTGLFHLCCLLFGLSLCSTHHHQNDHLNSNHNSKSAWATKCLLYDIILGLSGLITTLTAATSFPHKHILNRPGESGTLSHAAMVTQGEMVEHSFYQGVNLVQALYLHWITWGVDNGVDRGGGGETGLKNVAMRFGMLMLVTFPWTKNQHNDNVNVNNTGNNGGIRVGTEKESKYMWLINGMYRFKKWQYVFYKHVILHGLNISVAITTTSSYSSHAIHNNDTLPLPLTPQWRTFWLLLNTSYVMEFFLQSLVKRHVLTQRSMIVLNTILMISASMESNVVLGQVKLEAVLISMGLNFWNRGHDLGNTLVAFVVVYFGNQLLLRI